MIKKANTMKKNVLGFFKNLMKRLDEWDDLYYSIHYFLEKENLDNLYVVLDGYKITDIVSYDYTYGIKTLYPYFLNGEKCHKSTIENIKNYFKRDVLISTEWVDTKKYGLIDCNLKSSFDENHVYHLRHYHYTVLVPENENMLRDAIEQERFPTLSKITFKVIDGKEVCNYLYNEKTNDYPLWSDKYNKTVIAGFHYFQNDFCEHHKLLIAECDNMPIGVIKFGRYYEETSNAHYGLNYIDVNFAYRQKGIAKMLISEFAKIIPNDLPLVLSSESEMGKKCKMEEHFKNEKWNTELFTSKEWDEFQLRRCFAV